MTSEGTYSNLREVFQNRAHDYAQGSRTFPLVRYLERERLFKNVHFRRGNVLLDLQSASGYVADGLRDLTDGECRIIALEESQALAELIPNYHEVRIEPLHQTTIPTASVDSIFCLAGFHHNCKPILIFEEAYRVLRPCGRFHAAEVRQGSSVARWLNVVVEKFSPNGHRGAFFQHGDFSRYFRDSGFVCEEENVEQVFWNFGSEDEMVLFCKTFFGLKKASFHDVRRALYDTFPITIESSGIVRLGWELIYAIAHKPSL